MEQTLIGKKLRLNNTGKDNEIHLKRNNTVIETKFVTSIVS